VVSLNSPSDSEDLAPIPCCLIRLEVGWFDDMPAAPDHDRVAALHVGPLQVGVTVGRRLDAHAEAVVVGPAVRAHGAAPPVNERLPVLRPPRAHPVASSRQETTVAEPSGDGEAACQAA